MKIKIGGLAAITGAALLLLAAPAFGQYYGPYSGPTLSNGQPVAVGFDGNWETDPTVTSLSPVTAGGIYSGSVNLSPAGIVCDDLNDPIDPPNTWLGTAYQASTLGTTTPITDVLFGGANLGYANIGVPGYAAVADLVNQMFNTPNTPANTTLLSDLSEAIWSITDPGLPGYTGVDTAALVLAAQAEAYAAGTNFNMSQYSNLWVLTPTLPPSPYGPKIGQEVWIDVPEGGAAFLYLLLAGGVCLGAMFLNSRNRFASLASA